MNRQHRLTRMAYWRFRSAGQHAATCNWCGMPALICRVIFHLYVLLPYLWRWRVSHRRCDAPATIKAIAGPRVELGAGI